MFPNLIKLHFILLNSAIIQCHNKMTVESNFRHVILMPAAIASFHFINIFHPLNQSLCLVEISLHFHLLFCVELYMKLVREISCDLKCELNMLIEHYGPNYQQRG